MHFGARLHDCRDVRQALLKGVSAAGSLSAGWGFHCWTTTIGNQSVKVRYSAAGANAMVADGSIVTNAVFDRGVSAMFSPTISDCRRNMLKQFNSNGYPP